MGRSVFSRFPLYALVFVAACQSTSPGIDELSDTDGGADCPGPQCDEVCGDTIDNDDDGLLDCDDPDCESACDFDLDDDGFEDEAVGGDDCDDTNAAIHPDADEVCDGLDNDCNLLTDEDDPGLDTSTLSDWYRDADVDGYGDLNGSAQRACTAPSGSVLDNTDCDDDDATINPAAIDVPGDCIDNDCDGYVVDANCGTVLYLVRESDGMFRQLQTGSMIFTDIGLLGVDFEFGELAYDDVAGVMYMVDGDAANALYTVDLATGAATLVGVHGQSNLFGLAVSPAGELFATDGVDADLFSLDPVTGAATSVAMTRPAAGLTWDTLRGAMVGLNSVNGDVAEIDPVTGVNTWLANPGAIEHCGFAYDSASDVFWAIDQGGFLYTYDPNNGYARTEVMSNLGAHDGLTVGP